MNQLDHQIIDDLQSCGAEGAARALEQFCGVEPTSIRNPAAFLKGILNKLKNENFQGPMFHQAATGQTYWSLLKAQHDIGAIDMNALDAAIMADLEALPPHLAVQAVGSYLTAHPGTIRNPCGFMKGIINSLRKEIANDVIPDFGIELHPMVQVHLERAIAKGAIAAHQLDSAIVANLASFDPNEAIRILADFVMTDPSRIINKPGFFVSVMKRHREGRATLPGESQPQVEHLSSEGVTILDTLQEMHNAGKLDMTELDGAILRELETLPHEQALQAIESYLAADHSHIRNRCGFLKGIINLLRKDPEGMTRVVELAPAVREQLDAAIAQGTISEVQCDAALLATLATFTVPEALSILAEFMGADPNTIQNKAGFFCGIMKRHRMAGASPTAIPSTHTAQKLLEHYHQLGKLDKEAFDDDIVSNLASLPPGGAAQALSLFVAADQADIRNAAGFLKGIINKMKREGPGQATPYLPPPSLYHSPHPQPYPHAYRPAPPQVAPRGAYSASLYAPRSTPISAAPVYASAPAYPPPARAAPVLAAKAPKPVAAAAAQADRIFCPSCGLQQPRLNFCSNCGFSMTSYLADATVAAPSLSR